MVMPVDGQVRSMGVDVARFSSGFTAIHLVEGGRILHAEAATGQDLLRTAGSVIRLAGKYGIPKERAHLIAVDDTGVGGGETDRLREQGWGVQGENFGAVARDAAVYSDRRSEHWWSLRDWIRDAAALADAPARAWAMPPNDSEHEG